MNTIAMTPAHSNKVRRGGAGGGRGSRSDKFNDDLRFTTALA